jgi:hypothetical protein
MCKHRYVYERSLLEHRKDVDVCKRWYSDRKKEEQELLTVRKEILSVKI